MINLFNFCILAKVAVQVVDYYKQALSTLQTSGEEGPLCDLLGSRVYKDWIKYLNFKVMYFLLVCMVNNSKCCSTGGIS